MAAETYLIGIAGPSGAGKSYLAKHLKSELKAEVLGFEPLYPNLPPLPLEQRARMKFDAPEALEHELLIAQVARLRDGETVQLPVYDFTTHTRVAETQTLPPSEIII